MSVFAVSRGISILHDSLRSSVPALRSFVTVTMEAVRVRDFGDPSVLKLEKNVPIPVPNENQILIRVQAAGVNPVDTYLRQGAYPKLPKLPYTPGKDGAGIIEKLGSNVNGLKIGQRVFCCQRGNDFTEGKGTYSQYVCMDSEEVFSLGDRLSFVQGAAIGVPYFTAYRALVIKGEARAGQTVLIHGASGAVGLAAVQLGRFLGLRVIGTAGSEKGLATVKEQGADYVFDHSKPGYMSEMKNTVENGIDLILEMLSNVNLGEDLGLLASRARVLVVGCRGPVEINPRLLMSSEGSVTGVNLMASTKEEWLRTGSAIVEGIQLGWVAPLVEHQYTLEEAAQAHTDIMEKKGRSGKLVLALSES